MFPYMDRIEEHKQEICIRENPYICIFYPVRRISLISPETYTVNTNIDILKISICKEIFS